MCFDYSAAYCYCYYYVLHSLDQFISNSLIVYPRCLRHVVEVWSFPKPMVIYFAMTGSERYLPFPYCNLHFITPERCEYLNTICEVLVYDLRACLLVFSGTIICCNYFYIIVKWPLTCILISIKAHLLEDKQISSLRVYDEAKNDPFLGGHLSPELNLFDKTLP